jgi:hypothetical protein
MKTPDKNKSGGFPQRHQFTVETKEKKVEKTKADSEKAKDEKKEGEGDKQ